MDESLMNHDPYLALHYGEDKHQYLTKLNNVKAIRQKLNIQDCIYFSFEDLKDAYVETKIDLFKERIQLLNNRLNTLQTKKECHFLYRELQDLEHMTSFLEKKHSRLYKKAKKKISEKK